jgi:catechol 2,3-dioxygenase-like lactoylglutathione lyase family enzyme
MSMNIRRVQHVSIPVAPGGAEAARAFYGGVLGLVEKRVPESLDASMLTWFAVGDQEHELHCFVDPAFENQATAAHLCLEVADIGALRKRIEDRGIAFDHDPAPIHNRPRSFVRDPFGNLIEFTQINGRYDEE